VEIDAEGFQCGLLFVQRGEHLRMHVCQHGDVALPQVQNGLQPGVAEHDEVAGVRAGVLVHAQ